MTFAQIFQLVFILAFLVFILYVGKTAKEQISSHTDFHLAGRQMSWFIIAAGLVGTNFSGATFTSVTRFAYQYGLGGMLFQTSTIIGFLICAWIYAKRVRLAGTFTISELFEIRYNFSTRLIAGFFIMGSGIAAAAAQFKAVGLIAHTLFGIPEFYGIFACWIVIVLYMTMAGFWATNLTNIPQLVFCIIGFPAVLIWAMISFGGIGTITAAMELPAGRENLYFSLAGAPLAMVMTWVLQWMWINEWGSQWYFQRASAARNVWHSRFGFLMTAVILVFIVLIPGTGIGLYARFLEPNLANPEMALSYVINKAPAICSAIAAAGVFAAAMSTVDGCSMGAITVLARDFYHRTLRPNASHEQMTLISRIITVIVLITVLLCATALESAIAGLNFIFVFNTGIFGAILGAMFWKKACKEAATISILVAGVTSTIWTFAGYNKYFQGAWWSLMLSVCLMVIISLIVEKTGPWWGKEEEKADPEIEKTVLDFMQNRNATLADIIDRTGAHAAKLRPTIRVLVRTGKIREIGYMTYSLAENSKPEDVFIADGSAFRTTQFVIAAIACLAAFILIWHLSM